MRWRRAAVACSAALVAASPAHAVVLASASAAGPSATSGTYVAALAVDGTPVLGPLQVAVARSPKVVPDPTYLDVVNVGTLPLVGAAYGVAVVGQREAVLEACTGAWDEATHTCAGTVVELARSATGLTDSAVTVPAPGDRRRVRVRVPRTLPQDVLVTVEVAVSRAHARPAVTTSG